MEGELAALQLQLKLTSGPKRSALELFRKVHTQAERALLQQSSQADTVVSLRRKLKHRTHVFWPHVSVMLPLRRYNSCLVA